MKTTEFIDALDSQKIVPNEILSKLRAKIEKTDKNISAKSIAKYLIDKGYLSKYQARQVLMGELKSAAKEELDLKVPQEQINDTNELLKDLNPPANKTSPPADATVAYSQQDPTAGYDPSIEVVDVAVEQTLQHGFEDGGQGEFNPLGGGEGGFDSQYGEPEVEESPLDAFKGKKGKKNQWDSKWIFIGSAGLALLCMVGLILAFTIFKADSAKAWEEATKDFNNARWSTSLGKLQQYVKDFPNDEKVPEAKVMIANCELRIPYDSSNWNTALARSQTVLPELYSVLETEERTELFDNLRDDLGVILPGTALGFTDKGLDGNDVEDKKQQLKLAEDTKELIDNATFVPGSQKRKPAVAANLKLLDDNIGKIRRQITMEHEYVTAVETMKTLTEQGDTETAFETFEALVSIYPELRTREELEGALLDISLREAELVRAIEVDLAAPEMPESPIASSIVLATKTGQRTIAGLGQEMLVYLVNGSLYGMTAVDGHVAWRKYVGIETEIDPIWLGEPNKSDVLAVDSNHHDLIRLSSTDGSEIWRIRVGESFAKPNVASMGLLVTTHSGKVMVIDPNDGSISKAAQVPKKASVSGLVIEGLPFIYQFANNSNVYVISSETMECREVFYMGHDTGSIAVTPFVMSGHIVVPVNSPQYCNLNVLRPYDKGLKLDRAQGSIRMNGQIHTPLTSYNRRALVMSDAGDLRMLEVNKANEEQPVTVVVQQKISAKRKTRNFISARSGAMWLSGAGVRRFRVQKAAGIFKEEVVANNLDVFLGPNTMIGETLFHIRRRHDSTMISISAVNPDDLKEIWRTDMGAPLAGQPISNDTKTLAVSAQGDVFEIDQDAIDTGVSNSPIVRGSTVVQSLVFNNVVDFGNKVVMTGPVTRRAVLAVDLARNPPSTLTDLQLRENKLSCLPIAFGDELLVPTQRGQVFRIDTQTGISVGAPFGPKSEPNTIKVWRRPVAIDDTRFIIGDDVGLIYLVEADGKNSLKKLDEMEQPGLLISPMASVDGAAFAVSRDDAGDRLMMIPFADKLQVAAEADLPGGYVDGPFKIADDKLAVLLDSGETVCFNSTLEQQWLATLPEQGNDRMAGTPTMSDDGQLMIAYVSGRVISVNPDSGEITGMVDLQQPIAYAPVKINDHYFVTGADGTLHRLNGLF